MSHGSLIARRGFGRPFRTGIRNFLFFAAFLLTTTHSVRMAEHQVGSFVGRILPFES